MAQKYNTSQFKNGLKILIDSEPYIIIENEFEKPGKGQAFTRLKIKNLLNGKVLERTYKSGQSVEGADITEKNMTYIYHEDSLYYFMDQQNFEQISIEVSALSDQLKWLKEDASYTVLFWNDQPVNITPEKSMIFTITSCEPNVKGDTATSVVKNAQIETGATIKVPGFIKQGESIKVDTRDGSYISRA
ncbi:MAG: elongation factor P [Pseudomonadota bacterium]|nr:elongation factor P [Pseudomonadota bacterium]MEC8461196.1 elongation factor P [Pseudomonadota bacterium]